MKLLNLVIRIKLSLPSLPRNYAIVNFGKLLIVFSKMYICYTCSIQGIETALFSASDKVKLFANIFSKKSNLDDSGISLSAFLSGLDCIPEVVLKNCKPKL